MTQIMCTPGTHVAQVAHYQAPELNGLLLRLGLTDRLRMRREGLADRDLERGLGEGLTDLVGLLLLREAPFKGRQTHSIKWSIILEDTPYNCCFFSVGAIFLHI